jgi:hypothetical protein
LKATKETGRKGIGRADAGFRAARIIQQSCDPIAYGLTSRRRCAAEQAIRLAIGEQERLLLKCRFRLLSPGWWIGKASLHIEHNHDVYHCLGARRCGREFCLALARRAGVRRVGSIGRRKRVRARCSAHRCEAWWRKRQVIISQTAFARSHAAGSNSRFLAFTHYAQLPQRIRMDVS